MSEKQLVLTRAGLRKVDDELRELQTVRRQEVAEHIRQSKEYGDVAENPEYEDAKTEQAFLEGRIAELKAILSTARIIEDEDISTEEVGIGGVIRVRDLDANEEWEFTMVGSFEASPEDDRISNESPIGMAMLGARVGQVVSTRVPAGEVSYEVLSIRKPDTE